MKKALLITLTIAALGILAAYVNPLGSQEARSVVGATKLRATSGVTAAAANSDSQKSATTVTTTANTLTGNNQSTTSGYKDGTYQGDDYYSDYGDVQISVVIQNGKIAGVRFDQLTAYDGHSREINKSAAPILKQQTLDTQSAQIDGVSGATYTSSDYEQSLQSALDKAKV